MKIKNTEILLFGSFGILFVFMFYFYFNWANRHESLIYYPDGISSIVLKKKDGSAGSKITTFEGGLILRIGPSFESDTVKRDQLKLKKWNQSLMSEFIQPGDSLLKHPYSNTIYVYRKGVEYIFIAK